MRLVILLLIGLTLSAKTIFILETTDLLGTCVIEIGDVIIKHPSMDLYIPRGIEVIECTNTECIEHEVDRYNHLYRTNGIRAEVIK